MTIHKVKSWAHFFDAIRAGNKLHDLRKLDRDYKVGDTLVLQRYDNINGEYTGDEIEVEISYITSNKVPCAFSSSALDKDYGIFSLKLKPSPVAASREAFIPWDRYPSIVQKDIFNGEISINDARKTYATGGTIAPQSKSYLFGEVGAIGPSGRDGPTTISTLKSKSYIPGTTGPAKENNEFGSQDTKPNGMYQGDRDSHWEEVGEYRG